MTGLSINFIAALNQEKQIYGFDSFEGLPEPWYQLTKGAFALKQEFSQENYVPLQVRPNVSLFKGIFSETLPAFKEMIMKSEEEPRIAFIHMDCDLYSSTKCVFDILGDLIGSGTVI